jgi:hypothetical protein
MGEKALVDEVYADTQKLVQKLDADGEPPSFVAWYFYSDASEWRLIIASPTLDSLLPKQEPIAYQRVIAALSASGASALAVSDLKIVHTSFPLLGALRFLVRTDPRGFGRAHFTDCSINGMFIKEVIVFRSA